MSIPEAESPALKFEDALARLEVVIARLEGGDLPLEEALSLFEEGVRLTRLCSARLDEAERKVSLLLRDQEGLLREVPFSEAEEQKEEE
jgi:exodeoxyribonuclease VII small subunit